MQKNLFHLLLCVGAAMSIIGCSSKNNTVQEAQNNAFPSSSIQPPPPPIEATSASANVAEAAAQAAAQDESMAEKNFAATSGTTSTYAWTHANNGASSEASVGGNAANRAFMRSAELRFRVDDVKETTERIEGLTRIYGGFVSRSEQQSQVTMVTSAPISNDSLLEKTLYTVTNNISLRIPNVYFDTLLVRLEPMIDFLEYRRLSADDVSLSLLTNSLRAKRTRDLAKNLRKAIDKNGKKLGEVNDAEHTVADMETNADNAEVRNMGIKDKIDFCEVYITIYQRMMQMDRVIADHSNVEKFRPSFFARLWEAIGNGWTSFWDFVISLAEVWIILIIFGGILYFIWKKTMQKKA